MANLKLSFAILFGFVAVVHAQFCYKRYVMGKWITQGNCDNQENDRQILKDDITKRANGGVRLVGGKSYGRVEIHYQGVWGTICDHDWDIEDATVVCHMLGFLKAFRAPHSASFGRGTGPVLLDDVSCSGSEGSITNCGHKGWGVNDCGHHQDASVICQRTGSNEENISVRLVGGNSSYGRVEIYLHGIWGTICDENWDINDARVTCRMLGFPNAVAALRYAFFREGSGTTLITDVACIGNESSIAECRHGVDFSQYYCSHFRYASVICHEGYINVRLADGNSSYGRVEVSLDGAPWGTICDTNWDIHDAKVICRMLGYPDAAAVQQRTPFGQGRGAILLDNIACLGNETSISDCRHGGWMENHCSHYHDASVICQTNTSGNISVRLADGNSTYGRVEVSFHEVWGTICGFDWDINDARVICRMLGFPNAAAALRLATFGKGTGAILLDNVACFGNESSISECRHDGWGQNFCRHYGDVSVICQSTTSGNISARLVGGNSSYGRVEISFHGVWGTICDYNWDINDARVICRMLGYPDAVAALRRAHFGQGTGAVLLHNVECSGNESSVTECRHSNWGEHYCEHNRDASVICQLESNMRENISM